MAQKPRVAAVALTALFVATAAAASTITGTVSNETHVVLTSMVVAAYDMNGSLQGTATTDSAGHYVLEIQPGNYRILAYDPNGSFATTFDGDADSFDTSPIISVAAQPTVLDFALRQGGNVTGKVFAANNRPLAQATVAAYNLSGTRRSFAQCNDTGSYSIVLPPGQYKIVAYDDAGFFAPRFYPDLYGFNDASPVTITAGGTTAGKDIHLEFAAHLGGTVTDSDSGANLARMTVYAYDNTGTNVAQATTNSNGQFVLNVPSGSFRLVATDGNLVYATGYLGDTQSFDQSLAVSLASAQSRLDMEIPLHRGGTVAGRVTGSGGALLPNIAVAAYNPDGSQRIATHTDGSGAYKLVLSGGAFRLAAFDEQLTYATQFYPTQNTFRAATDILVTPPATIDSIDFALIHGAKISGTVTESGTGVTAFAVSVAAYDEAGDAVNSTITSATGNYILVVPPGTYKVVAFDMALRYATAYGGGEPNYEAAAVYTVNSDRPETLNFTVTRGVRVGGSVTDAASLPLSGIEIRALDLAGNRVATTMATAGGFTLVLIPGSYKLLAADLLAHYGNIYYSSSVTFGGATTVIVQSGAPVPPISFMLSPHLRRRAAPH
jgi:hypothetical protein